MAQTIISSSVETISAGLNEIFKGLEGSYVKSSNSNRIIITQPEYLSTTTLWIDALAEVAPGRFFVVCVDEQLQNSTEVNLSARCSQLSKGLSVCSEVITLNASTKNIKAVASIVRAHSLTGRRTELVLFSDIHKNSQLLDLVSLSDFLIIDSSIYWKQPVALRELIKKFDRIMDVQWLTIAPWRESLRNACELSNIARHIASFNQVTITTGSNDTNLSAHMYLGWFCHMLNIRPEACTAAGFECRKSDGSIFNISQNKTTAVTSRGIASVCFECKSNSPYKLEFILDANYRLQILFNQQLVLVEKIEQATTIDALTRYFAVGESTVCYNEAVLNALEFAQLEQGYM